MRRILAAALGGLLLTGTLSAAATTALADPPPDEPTAADTQVVLLAADDETDSDSGNDPDPNTQPGARHTGQVPHAVQEWPDRVDCLDYNRVNGSIPAGFQVNDVIAELRNKVPALPTLRDLNASCPSSGNTNVIRVDYVPNPDRHYCANWIKNAGLGVVQLSDNNGDGCPGHLREWGCSGIAMSVGAHGYTGSTEGRGCRWTAGVGPDHLTTGPGSEAGTLQNAWN